MTRFAQTLRIGGTLAPAAAPAFLAALRDAPDDEGGYRDVEAASDLDEYVDDTIDGGPYLVLADAESSGSSYDALTAACRALGLSYDLYSDAGGDPGGPMVECWRPGMDEARYDATIGYLGDIAVERAPLAQALAAYDAEVANYVHRGVACVRCIEAIRAALGPEVAPLPPFQVGAAAPAASAG